MIKVNFVVALIIWSKKTYVHLCLARNSGSDSGSNNKIKELMQLSEMSIFQSNTCKKTSDD